MGLEMHGHSCGKVPVPAKGTDAGAVPVLSLAETEAFSSFREFGIS